MELEKDEYSDKEVCELFEKDEHLESMKFDSRRRIVYTRNGHRILKSVYLPNGIRESIEVIKEDLWRKG
jgi:hypothetical protein